MAAQRPRNTEFVAQFEPLEDRRVMAAQGLSSLLASVQQPTALPSIIAPANPAELNQQVLGDPDFWITPQDSAALNDYFDLAQQSLADAHNQTGWFNVKNNYGFTGRGQTVAVIDSGVAYDHFALGGGFGSNYRVVGGWDFTENDWNPHDDGTAGGHGTHVAGIIGNSSTTNSGVAPGVDLVSLRVFNDAGAGYFSWVEQALRWVYQNRNSFENPITTVNLSIGVSSWNAATIPQWATLEDEFAQLEAAGIFIAVSAGNSFSSYSTAGLSYPASSQYVVPVMSTDDNGALSYFSQRLGRAIAAPGRNIVSTAPDYKGNNNGVADDFVSMSGTSMAAPYIAGASVIIREAMQFVGMTNITQDMIYDHMMATADTIYDSITKLSYKRLDLQAAVDALMPADDYGSTLAAAHNLGTLSGGSSVSGVIGSLTDSDYFRFTAGASGNVTFDLSSTSGNMAGSWQVYGPGGQSIAVKNGDNITFAVTAGQSYAVRLASSGGTGSYSFDITAAAAATFTFQDWGAVSYAELVNRTVAGEAWYKVRATQDGLLTAQALFNAAGGSVNLALFNSDLQLVANGSTAGGVARVDAAAAAGVEFFLRVSGSNGDVDFQLVNLVSQVGATVTVAGTSGGDVFAYAAGGTHTVSVNGVSYSFASSSANHFNFNGGAGADSITLTGTTATDTAALRVGSTRLQGAAYAANAAGFETVRVNGGGGVDNVFFYDSAGDDHLTAQQAYATMTGAGYSNSAYGFANLTAYASQGLDESELYDSAGNDRFIGNAAGSTLRGAGYSRFVTGFDNVYAYSFAGGADIAELWDSPQDDIFSARPTYATLKTTNTFNLVRNFEYVYGYAMLGGRDIALMFDSPDNDVFISRPEYSVLRGSNFYNFARGFESVRSYSTAGGNDTSWLFGSVGNDSVHSRGDQVWLYGAGFDLSAHGFGNTNVVGMGGNDSVRFEDLDGSATVTGSANNAYLVKGQRKLRVEDVDRVTAVQVGLLSPKVDVRAVDYIFEKIIGS